MLPLRWLVTQISLHGRNIGFADAEVSDVERVAKLCDSCIRCDTTVTTLHHVHGRNIRFIEPWAKRSVFYKMSVWSVWENYSIDLNQICNEQNNWANYISSWVLVFKVFMYEKDICKCLKSILIFCVKKTSKSWFKVFIKTWQTIFMLNLGQQH